VHDQSYSMTTLYHEQDMVNVEERKLREGYAWERVEAWKVRRIHPLDVGLSGAPDPSQPPCRAENTRETPSILTT